VQGQQQSTTSLHIPATISNGKELRALREDLNVTQAEFAPLLGTTKSHVSQMEWKDSRVSPEIGRAALAVARTVLAGRVTLPAPRKAKDALHSKNFSRPAPFDRLLDVCPICNTAECQPKPVRDFEQDNQHLWVFSGANCHKSFCLDESGKFAGTPDSLARPVALRKVCGECGRLRVISKKFRSRLNCNVNDLRCRRGRGDAPNQMHDPPVFFREESGRLVELTRDEIARMHGRNSRQFAVPAKWGKRMERSSVLRLSVKGGGQVEIATYRLRRAEQSVEYRVLPNREQARRIGLGRYVWKNSQTGEILETVRRTRTVRTDRVMPTAKCRFCDGALRILSGPWQVLRGKRWRAECGRCRKAQYVSGDGSVQFVKGTRFRTAKRIPPRSGMTKGRIEEATKLDELVRQAGGKRGALKKAAQTVYQGVRFDLAYDRARQTLKDWKRAGRPEM
jgi:hypothetical protein